MADYVQLKVTGMEGVLETLKSLPAEVVSKRGGPVKLSLAKGARMLRDAAKVQLAQSIAINGSDSTGTTVKSVIATRGKVGAGFNGEKYLVRVKNTTFLSASGKKVSTLMTANLLEWGSKHQSATPWLRPAAQANAQRIVDTVSADLVRRVNLIVKKLAIQNKVPQ